MIYMLHILCILMFCSTKDCLGCRLPLQHEHITKYTKVAKSQYSPCSFLNHTD